MTAAITREAATWKLPDLDTVYYCEDMGPMTLGQMLDGMDPDLVPTDQTMYEDLLWAFGAWETLEEMDAAMAMRDYADIGRVCNNGRTNQGTRSERSGREA